MDQATHVEFKPTLTVEVKKCVGLVNKDIGSDSDPYCAVQLMGANPKESEYNTCVLEERRTKTLKDNLNPVFDESFTFQLSQDTLKQLKYVRFELWDEDVVGRDFLGQASVSVDVVSKLEGKSFEQEMPLRSRAIDNSDGVSVRDCCLALFTTFFSLPCLCVCTRHLHTKVLFC